MPQMTVQEVDVKAERRKRRIKTAAISVAAVVVLAGGSGMAWYLTPPAMPETIAEAEALVESPRFERLSKQAKQPYLDVIREQFGSLDRAERQAMMRENEEMREALRASRDAEREAFTRAYVLATPEERRGMMAEVEGEREARRAEGGERGGRGEGRGGDGGGRGDGGGPSNDRVNDRMTNGSAQNSQLRGEMRAERRKQREGQNGS